MNTVDKKKVILGAIALALLVTIPLTVSQLSKRQTTLNQAALGASLSFTPNSTPSSPIQSTIGGNIDLDMYIDPGTSSVTFVRYQVTYDPTKVKLVSSGPVDLNSNVFTSIEGPVMSSDSIAQSVSIGSDPTKVVTQKTKVATLHFMAIGSTNGTTTTISFGTMSQVLSAGSHDQANQNVLSTTTPATVSIGGSGGPTGNPTTIPIPTVTGTALNFTLLLHGIGSAGDNPNPEGNSLSNKNPLHPQRDLSVTVFDTNNQSVATSTMPVTFDSTSGTFIGAVGLPATLPSGNYSVKIQTKGYLRRLVPGIQQIVSGQATDVPAVQMIAGDTNNDNVLNVLDYNALLDCGYGQLTPLPMTDPNSKFHSSACQVHSPADNIDVNDDGIINSTDYNLFLRELSVQNGD